MDQIDQYNTDTLIANGYDPSLFYGDGGGGNGGGGQPVASTGKNDPTSIWGQLGAGLLTSTGSVLTNQLNASNQLKLAKARAKAGSGTMTLIIMAVVGLVVVGILFAVLKRK
jgi:hypothetical protein